MSDIAARTPQPAARPPGAALTGASRPAPRRQLRRASPLARAMRTIIALMLREIATTYGRSPGGYLWALADPILGIALLTVIFQVALGSTNPLLGSNFPLFYASGYLPFMMYHDIANKLSASLRFSRPLLAYPAVTFVDALLARWLLNAITHVIIFVIVVGTIVLIYDLPPVMDVGVILHAMGLCALLGAGVGTMNCFLTMRFPIWERAWSILTRPLLLVSGIFYTFETLPNLAREMLWWNPIFHLIGLMRRGIYVVYPADYVSEWYVVILSLVLLLLGLLLIHRRYRDLLEQM